MVSKILKVLRKTINSRQNITYFYYVNLKVENFNISHRREILNPTDWRHELKMTSWYRG